MKLNDVIKEMQVDSNWGEVHLESCVKWMRIACKAMAKKIVPRRKNKHPENAMQDLMQKEWNACRDEILKNIAEFMGGEEMRKINGWAVVSESEEIEIFDSQIPVFWLRKIAIKYSIEKQGTKNVVPVTITMKKIRKGESK